MQAMVAERPIAIPPSGIKLVLKGPVAEGPKNAGVREYVRATRQVQGQRVETDAKARSGIALPDGDDTPQFDRPEVRQHAHQRQHSRPALEAGPGVYACARDQL